MATTIPTEKATWAVRMIRLRRASASGWSMGVAVIRTHPSSGLAARQNAALYSACCSRWVAADIDSSADRFMALRTGQLSPTRRPCWLAAGLSRPLNTSQGRRPHAADVFTTASSGAAFEEPPQYVQRASFLLHIWWRRGWPTMRRLRLPG
jgi:hypothetical protein